MNRVVADNVSKMFDLRLRANEEESQERAETAKANLLRSASTKVQTAFIGALASFENHFGYLWGHGEMKLTQEQEDFKEVWQKVRKEILDKGNDQIKLIKNDFSKVDINYAKVKVTNG
jgi:hypothetical protein